MPIFGKIRSELCGLLSNTGECQLANKSAKALAKPDPERHHSEKTNFEHHPVEAITTALAINDEFYKGLAIRRVINVCRNANELDIAKMPFKEVDHPSLCEQIVKDVPELAGERRLRNENACQTVPSILMVSSATRSYIL